MINAKDLVRGRVYRIDHIEGICKSTISKCDKKAFPSVKVYSYNDCIVYLKVQNSSFILADNSYTTYQNDEWTYQECGDALLFNKINLDLITDDVKYHVIESFLLGKTNKKIF